MPEAAHDAEQRLRDALATGTQAAGDDLLAVLDELAAQRQLAAARWVAIGALAPTAKAMRMRVLELERAMRDARHHLDRAIAGGVTDGEVAAARAALAAPPR
jgi:hypothetical protein